MIKARAITYRFVNSGTCHADRQVWQGAALNEIADKHYTAPGAKYPFVCARENTRIPQSRQKSFQLLSE